MTATSTAQTRDSQADELKLMDREGFLYPAAKEALRLRAFTAEPLLESDPVLREHLERFIGLSGVGAGNHPCLLFLEQRGFFASIERLLIGMLPTGERSTPSAEHVEKISTIIDSLRRTDVCLVLARNSYLSSELHRTTEAYLGTLSTKVQAICDSLLSEVSGAVETKQLVDALVDLRDLPRRMRLLVSLNFQCSALSEIRPGDTLSIDQRGRRIVLQELRDGQADLLHCDVSRVKYQRSWINLSAVDPSRICIRRGINTLIPCGEEPFSAMQPFRTGVHVMRPPSPSQRRSYDVGEIVGFHREGPHVGQYEVLWRGANFSATVMPEQESNLRVLGHGDTSTISDSLTAQALTDYRRSPLYTYVRAESALSRDRDARQLRSLCTAILSAEYPLAIHVMGSPYSRTPVVEQLSSRVASCSQGGLPQEDASFLRRHGCTPVLIVVESENHQYLTQEIKELREKGWEIIICSNNSMVLNDKYIEHAICDLPVLMGEGAFTQVDISRSTVEPISAALEILGARARQALDTHISQRSAHTEVQRRTLDSLSALLDGLAEADPTRALTRRPLELQRVKDVVGAIRRGDGQQASKMIDDFAAEWGALTHAEHGVTQTQQSWSFRELIELSAALAKSRLPANHPAVLLRGITCLDLSPAALAAQLNLGAQIFRHVDSTGVTRSIVISLPPAVTDATRPGLSESLNHKNSVGYIYWIWIDPEGTQDVRAPFNKLLNRVALEQLAEGASFVVGRVLERNASSLRAFGSVGGFDIIPTRAIIGGEPAVAVGINLSLESLEAVEEAPQPDRSMALDKALDVFASGIHDDIAVNQELRASKLLRINETHEFLVHAYALRSTCERVLNFVTNELRWRDGYHIILEAKAALEHFAPWLSKPQMEDFELALDLCTDDSALEVGKAALRKMLGEVVREDLTTLLSVHTRLKQKALSVLAVELAEIIPPVALEGLRQREATVRLPPRIDIVAAHESFQQLPLRAQRILDSWWDFAWQRLCWVKDTHPNAYGCHSLIRDWIERDVADHGGFCRIPGVPTFEGEEHSEAMQKHFEQFAQVIEWANEVARAGHFDQHVARFLYPIIQALLGRNQ
jgi:hypothetical protein